MRPDSLNDEGEHEAEQGEGLDHGEADECRRHHGRTSLRLASSAIDDGRKDPRHAESRAEGCQAVAEELSEPPMSMGTMVCPSGLCPLWGVVFVAGRFDDEV